MFFRVPVGYRAEIIEKGRRTRSEQVLCGEWIDVEVAEADDLEAPVATRWRAALGHDEIVGGIYETRWFGGRHYGPALDKSIDHPSIHVDVAAALRSLESGVPGGNPLIKGGAHTREVVQGNARPLAERAVREILWSERDKAIAEARERAASVLVVHGPDGTAALWVARDEPICRINPSNSFGPRYIHASVIGTNAIGRSEPGTIFFRADRYEDMRDHCRDLVDEERLDVLPRVHVVIQESIRYDDETPAFLSAAHRALNAGRSDLDSRSREAILAWIDLRDLLARIRDEGALPDHLDALERALEEYRGTMPLTDHQSEQLGRALGRWNLRPLALPGGFHEGPGIGFGP